MSNRKTDLLVLKKILPELRPFNKNKTLLLLLLQKKNSFLKKFFKTGKTRKTEKYTYEKITN